MKNNERGNVIIFILVAVFLFGMLGYTFARTGRDGQSSISIQQAKLAAQEILNYARLVEGAVNRVRRNGCSEGEISFLEDWNDDGVINNGHPGDQANTTSPADRPCRVFDENGGKLAFMRNYSFFDDGDLQHGQRLTGIYGVSGFGIEDKADLLYGFRMRPTSKNLEICNAINKALRLPENIIDSVHAQNFYYFSWTGTYRETVTPGPGIIGDNNTGVALKNKPSGCFNATGYDGGGYVFYHMIIPR